MRLSFLLIALSLAVPTLAKVEPLPVEKFTANAQFSRARLSPDGKSLAFIRDVKGVPWLAIMDLETRKLAVIDPGAQAIGPTRQIGWFRWISDKRIAFLGTIWDGAFYTGVSAVDRDGKRWKAFTGPDADPTSPQPLAASEIIYAFDDEAGHVLMLNRSSEKGNDRLFQDVIKVSSYSGAVTTVVQNPGNVLGWSADRNGVIRLGVTAEGEGFGLIYRENENAPWRPLPKLDDKFGRMTPLGFDLDNRRLLVAVTNEHQRRAVYYYDPVEGKLGELIASHATHDIVPERYVPYVDGVALAGLVGSELTGTVVGLRYMTEGPTTQWLDPAFAEIQQAVDQALPETVNLITSRSRDEKRLLVFSFSDREPGKYYLLDLTKSAPVFSALGSLQPDLPAAQMAPMFPVKYKARDGEVIHAYLTLPVGEQKKNLPLVVLPHGGPFVRDLWGFDPWAQFFANRGYAVLQMNYRGSPGYGTEFLAKGKREIGRGMQTDIDDGTRWAITQGIANPARIAIVGGSFGGYSALFALGRSPELYRCGISINGVTDWATIFKEWKTEEYKFAYAHFREWIGDPKHDATFLASISPVNFADKITAPVLIAQGKDDRIVPPKQARKMMEALEKAGRKPEVIYFDDGHGFQKEKNRTQLLRAIEAFLAKNLGPNSGA